MENVIYFILVSFNETDLIQRPKRMEHTEVYIGLRYIIFNSLHKLIIEKAKIRRWKYQG